MKKIASDFTELNHQHSHPAIFMLLVLPFGILMGYVTVTFSYLFSKAGVPLEHIAALVGASTLPHVIKFLWAPLVDTSLSLKKWYILSNFVTAAGIFTAGILPIKESSLPILTSIIIFSNVAASFLGSAANGLSAYDTPAELKGRVSGYIQAGVLGGSGIGGGLGLWLTQHLNSVWISGTILAVSCLLCCFGLFFVNEAISTIRAERMWKTFNNLYTDIWGSLKAEMGFLAIFLCFLPLGTGAASNLWSAIAGDWNASANTVAVATGVFGGIITSFGCLVGGWICDRMNRKMAYVIFGFTQVICAIAMAFSPQTEIMYIIWTSFYAISTGLAYAGFSAFVFEAIGRGAAATKFAVYASLSNLPIYYMTIGDGWTHTHFGPQGMLYTEAAIGIIGIILFLSVWKIVTRKKAVAVANFLFN